MGSKRYVRDLSPEFGTGLLEKRTKHYDPCAHLRGFNNNVEGIQPCDESMKRGYYLGFLGGAVLKEIDLAARERDSFNVSQFQMRASGRKSKSLTSGNHISNVKFYKKSFDGDSEVASVRISSNIHTVNNEVGHTKSCAPLFISTRSYTGESRNDKLRKKMFSSEQEGKQVMEGSGLGSPSKVVKDKSFRAHAGHRVQVVPSPTGMFSDMTEAGAATSNSVLSRLIASRVIKANETVRYLRKKDSSVMKEGRLTQQGVLCTCCDELFSLSLFEAHAGSKLHRPAANMFLADGRSLADCQNERTQPQHTRKIIEPLRLADGSKELMSAAKVRLSKEKIIEPFRLADGSKELMSAAKFSLSKEKIIEPFRLADGSKELMSAAKVRLSKEEVGVLREGDIICGICANGGQLICCDGCPSTFHQECLKIKELPEGKWFCYRCKCASCGTLEDRKLGALNSLRLCDQCDLHHHVSCCEGRQLGKKWFCGARCEKVLVGLQSLMNAASHGMGNGLSWSLLRSAGAAKSSVKLSNALNVLKECFHPIIDVVIKKDILSNVLYSRRSVLNRLNFHGFYTFVLEHEEQIVCAATVRFHGARFAEMPFVGTPFRYRRQGMCRVLVDIIEKVLCGLEVERIILPALPGVEDTWINSFNFQPVDDFLRHELIHCNLFPMSGVTLLQKSLSKSSESQELTSSRLSLVE
ncbi:hypothetical protein O6H91_04G087100 [Diphasiastrum complanatum]|uniref:Uncharacterized protein n=1 Tax=Diphasiastrum complanatum TaxID=34168 RepID=A0ACC2DZ32_DIPCM|nr:hypothetical protein O6H91_04G087100 [Diphasiastrum complanatum]